MDCLRIVGWKGNSESLPRQWIWEGEWALKGLTGAGSPGSGSSRFRLVECVHFWRGWRTGASGRRGPGQLSQSPPLSSPREEERLGGAVPAPSPNVLGLVSVPCLFILPPRVPSVLRIITENSVPHLFTFQAVKRLEPLRKLFCSPVVQETSGLQPHLFPF